MSHTHKDHKAYKAHVHYDLLKSVPVKATLTDANTSERQVLRENLEADRLYVLDRGYGSYQLMQDIINADSSFVCRMPQRYSRQVIENIELTPKGKEAGIISDQIAKLGIRETCGIINRHQKPGHFGKSTSATPELMSKEDCSGGFLEGIG